SAVEANDLAEQRSAAAVKDRHVPDASTWQTHPHSEPRHGLDRTARLQRGGRGQPRPQPLPVHARHPSTGPRRKLPHLAPGCEACRVHPSGAVFIAILSAGFPLGCKASVSARADVSASQKTATDLDEPIGAESLALAEREQAPPAEPALLGARADLRLA